MPRVWKVVLLLGLIAASTGKISWREQVRLAAQEETREEDDMPEDLEIVKDLEMLQVLQILEEMEILGEMESLLSAGPEQEEGAR